MLRRSARSICRCRGAADDEPFIAEQFAQQFAQQFGQQFARHSVLPLFARAHAWFGRCSAELAACWRSLEQLWIQELRELPHWRSSQQQLRQCSLQGCPRRAADLLSLLDESVSRRREEHCSAASGWPQLLCVTRRPRVCVPHGWRHRRAVSASGYRAQRRRRRAAIRFLERFWKTHQPQKACLKLLCLPAPGCRSCCSLSPLLPRIVPSVILRLHAPHALTTPTD